MEGKIRIFGHSVHPLLIVFPLGLLSTSLIFDVVRIIWGVTALASVSFWMIVAGIVGGLVAAPFGFIDWLAVQKNSRARSVGLEHGAVNLLVVTAFALSGYLRLDAIQQPPISAVVVSVIGFALALFGGWLGGELVERLAVGVHTGANANAPSSLAVGTLKNIRDDGNPQ